MRCNTYSRTDVLLSEADNTFYAIETNTLLGFAENSLFPKEAKAAGISGPELLDRVIQSLHEQIGCLVLRAVKPVVHIDILHKGTSYWPFRF